MSKNICEYVSASNELLALGEATHKEPAFCWVRNELFAQLVDRGFRSIALETHRVAAFVANDFVRDGIGSLDVAMSEGFSHEFGELDANRALIAWMREYNEHRPPAERLTFHGFDVETENTTAPSPRRYLEHARDYLGLDVDIAGLAGDDERWSREEAIMNPAASVGATADAERLRSVGATMLGLLNMRADESIAATSRADWVRARTQLTAGLGLLRYHKQAAEPLELAERVQRLLAVRDALMVQNLLAIRDIEVGRGATMVGAHNRHLQKSPSTLDMPYGQAHWIAAGTILSALLGERYAFVAASLGRSEVVGVGDPAPETYEGMLRKRVSGWGLVSGEVVGSAETRTDSDPRWGYYPLDREILAGADAILYIDDADAVRAKMGNPNRSTVDR